jgi:hypothetical protein
MSKENERFLREERKQFRQQLHYMVDLVDEMLDSLCTLGLY